jgi:hypothetical protein
VLGVRQPRQTGGDGHGGDEDEPPRRGAVAAQRPRRERRAQQSDGDPPVLQPHHRQRREGEPGGGQGRPAPARQAAGQREHARHHEQDRQRLLVELGHHREERDVEAERVRPRQRGARREADAQQAQEDQCRPEHEHGLDEPDGRQRQVERDERREQRHEAGAVPQVRPRIGDVALGHEPPVQQPRGRLEQGGLVADGLRPGLGEGADEQVQQEQRRQAQDVVEQPAAV